MQIVVIMSGFNLARIWLINFLRRQHFAGDNNMYFFRHFANETLPDMCPVKEKQTKRFQ